MNITLSVTEQDLRDANQALLNTSVHQHELTEQAERAEAALRDSEERLRGIFEQAVAGIVECDLDGRLLRVNPRFCEIVGRSAEELCGQPGLRMQDITHAGDLARSQELFDQTVTQGKPFTIEKRYVLPNGSISWASTSVSLVRQPHGAPKSVVAVCLDITEQKLAEAERGLLAQIVACSDDAIISKDLHGTITSWNKGAQRLFGYTTEEVLGKPVTLLIPQDRINEEPSILERIGRGEAVDHYETVRQRKDGSLVNISLTVSPIRDAAGRIIGAAKIARDITERKRAEQAVHASEERYRTLFDLGPVAIYAIDAAGVIQEFNRQAATLWGREPAVGDTDQLFCGSFKMFRPDGSLMPHDVCPMAEVVTGKISEVRDGEVHIERPDGSRVIVIVNIRPLKNARGEITGAINCFYDITERKQAEEALREADRRKDEFMAMLSHELRNPLAAMSSAIQLSQAPNVGAGELAWIHETLARQTEQLGHLVNDLLDMARIANGKIELKCEPVRLADLVDRTVETVRPLLMGARHQFSLTLPPEPIWVSGDPARLQQILSNLLTNAAKYTPDGGQIDLRASRANGEAVIAVKDNGIGLAPEMQSRVFDLFAQAAQGLDRAQGGLGIGLTLVRSLVERHGGSVSVSSDGLGRGSEFTIRLPAIDPPASPSGAVPQGDDRPVQPLRILIVDDNRDAARTLSHLLKLHGHETEVAYDGRQALAVAEQFRPAVALLDLGLPDINGFDLAVHLEQKSPEVYLVAISGYGQAADLQRSRAAGFAKHLLKPVKLDDLLSLLQQRATATCSVA